MQFKKKGIWLNFDTMVLNENYPNVLKIKSCEMCGKRAAEMCST